MRRNINGWGYQSIKPTQEYRDNYDTIKWDKKEAEEPHDCPAFEALLKAIYPDAGSVRVKKDD